MHPINKSLVCFLFSAMMLLLTPISAWTAPYQPPSDITLLSQSISLSSDDFVPKNLWHVHMEKNKASYQLTYRFAPDSSWICRIEIPLADDGWMRWRSADGREQFAENRGLLFIKGFPAPCDILPVEQAADLQTYTVETQAGGTVFQDRYQVIRTGYSYSEAAENGYIKIDDAKPVPLYWLRVLDSNGKEVCRQLWPQGGDWWLYEQTRYRRSWLVD